MSTSGSPLASLCREALEELGGLTDRFVARVWQLDPYRDDVVDRSEVARDAEASFELLLRSIGGLRIPDRLSGISEDIGRRRARSGVPLEVILQAIRIDFQLLWDLLVAKGEAAGDVLLRSAPLVWQALEAHTLTLQRGYLDEAALMAHEQHRVREDLVRRLVVSTSPGRSLQRQVESALDAVGGRPWLVLTAHLGQLDALGVRAAQLRERGLAAHAQELFHQAFLIVEQQGGRRDAVALVPGIVGGYSWCAELADLADAVSTARKVLRALPPTATGPLGPEDVWAALVADEIGSVGDAIVTTVLDDFQRMPDVDQRLLHETFLAYFTTGSSSRAGELLHVHRNTTINRLQKVHKITGMNPFVPSDAALLHVAFECAASGGAEPIRPLGPAAPDRGQPTV
ncbi:helix-turn-helix domain-containing protein [Nocardioides sp. L-11A]|uniref:helix-turn-helix domain-containing protein n=1 Tax=Nocardioides sp. L-11A TaxID=3043848 RepID=UPI00249BA394|nr:helix-turn-helix domain-containing protein [Nocardioides sp. L-11A]